MTAKKCPSDAEWKYLPRAQAFASISSIEFIVSKYFGIEISLLHTRNRSQKVAWPRQVVMALAYEMTDLSFPAVASYYAVNHATVIYACRVVESVASVYPKVLESLEALRSEIRNNNLSAELDKMRAPTDYSSGSSRR